MPFAERGGETQPTAEGSSDPLHPTVLPPNLAEFLHQRTFACLTHPTSEGTVLVVKAPARDIDSARGNLPIRVSHELYDHPAAPVIRMQITIYDQPTTPLALETFINVEDPQQRSDYETLTDQDRVLMLFFDEGLAHRLTKAVQNADRSTIRAVLTRADELFRTIPRDQFDFDAAKAEVMQLVSL